MFPLTVVTDPALTPLQAAVLGAVQGLTELLPISSSAHLYLVPTLLGWPYVGVAFDVAMHAGTLAALVLAFWGDWVRMFRDALAPKGSAASLPQVDGLDDRSVARMQFGMLVVATIPGLVAGRVLSEIEEQLRSVPLQAATLLVFGLLLWLVDRAVTRSEDRRAPGWGTALLVGLAQSLALVPGVSRSGVTMTAGRLAGLSRTAAARFSFMLSTPITVAALLYTGLIKHHAQFAGVPASTLVIGVVTSGLTGFLAIRFMMGLLKRTGFGVFAAYRTIVAVLLLGAWFGGFIR